MLGDFGHEVRDPFAAFAVLFELPLGTDDSALVFVAAAAEGFDRDGLAVEGIEGGFVVEGFDVAGAAIAEDPDAGLGFGGVVALARGERVGEFFGGRGTIEEAVAGEQAGQCDRAEPAADLPEEFATSASAELAWGGHRAWSPNAGGRLQAKGLFVFWVACSSLWMSMGG